MRPITSSFVALLSILMISSSASASVCDLSCWLRQAYSDCHSVPRAASDEKRATSVPSDMDMGPMDMAAGMNMGSNGDQGVMDPRLADAKPHHSVASQADVATESVRDIAASRSTTAAGRPHSKTSSPCAHQTCSQISASGSPPRPSQLYPVFFQWIMQAPVLSAVACWRDLHRIGPGTAPPEILPAERLATILRI